MVVAFMNNMCPKICRTYPSIVPKTFYLLGWFHTQYFRKTIFFYSLENTIYIMILSLEIFMNLFKISSMQIECHKLLSSTYYGVSCLSADCKTSKLSTSIASLSFSINFRSFLHYRLYNLQPNSSERNRCVTLLIHY